MPVSDGKWPGGYVRKGIYVIRRMVGGYPYDVSTRATSLRAAMKHLERFEADPAGYEPSNTGPDPVFITKDLVREYLVWSRDERGNTRDWLRKKKRFLAWWTDQLKGNDLRRVSLTTDIKPALAKATAPHHRTAALKAFYGWLRTEKHIITPAQDPTFGTLKVPQLPAEQLTRVKAVEKARYLKARSHLIGHYRDGLDVLAGTGWHVTELLSFARGGTLEASPRRRKGVSGILICPRGKNREPLRVAVGADCLEAARRIREHGAFSREWFDRAVRSACEAAGVEPFTPGVMRHSVATWAIDAGADPESVAAFLNHKSARTTQKFYATFATPKKVPTLL